MKISLITACYNSAKTIKTAMESVLSQKGVDIEYIVVDGGSTDGTVAIVENFLTQRRVTAAQAGLAFCSEPSRAERVPRGAEYAEKQRDFWFEFKWISERDRGMYDAINKGIKMATGDVVGILNADDVLATDDTLAHIAEQFSHKEQERQERGEEIDRHVDCVYADIRFVREGETVEALRGAKTVRYCSAAKWRPWMFRFAAMVPHPSFYVRRECFERLGGYSLDYRICADFELELRYLYLAKLRAAYLPECVVVMRMGGASTAGWRSNVEINREDLRALRVHGIWSCLPLIYLKYLFKIWGFVFRG